MTQVVEVANGRSVHFIWHGGEPLLAGLTFFEEVNKHSQLFRAKGHSVCNSIQTNGTLVTDRLLDFIATQRDFSLSFSLDGPRDLNDRTRMYKDGRGCFDDVFSGMHKTRDLAKHTAGFYPGGGVIVVVNKHNIKQLPGIYCFFRAQRMGFKLIPVIISGSADKSLAVSPIEFATAMNSLFDTWIDDTESVEIDPFTTMLGNLLTSEPIGCHHSVSCAGNFVAIGPLGDVYPCGRFDGVPEYHLGNVNDSGGLAAALNSSCHERLRHRTASTVPGCTKCEFSAICHGGCMHNAANSGDLMARDPFCSAYKLMYAHMRKYLLGELKRAT